MCKSWYINRIEKYPTIPDIPRRFFQDAIDMAIHGSRMIGFAFLLNGFNIFSASFFTALENAKGSLIISSCRESIFIVGGITVLPLMFQTNGLIVEICFMFLEMFNNEYWQRQRARHCRSIEVTRKQRFCLVFSMKQAVRRRF